MNRNPNGYMRQNNNYQDYGTNSQTIHPPVQTQEKVEQPKNFEALLMKILDQQNTQNKIIERLEHKVAKIDAEQEKGKFPGQPIQNPKPIQKAFEVSTSTPPIQQEEAKVITTLRSGRI